MKDELKIKSSVYGKSFVLKILNLKCDLLDFENGQIADGQVAFPRDGHDFKLMQSKI